MTFYEIAKYVDVTVIFALIIHVPSEVGCIHFLWKSGILFIELPSGRRLSYMSPRLGVNQFGSESITYLEMQPNKKWDRSESFGPKIVENIVQGISRDILCNTMKNLSDQFICAHVHDELIIESSPDVPLDVICAKMAVAPDWLPNIELRADGYACEFYMKD